MKKLNQKGFGLVPGLLIVLIILGVAFGGYYVWNNEKDDPETKNSSVDSTQQKETEKPAATIDETESWTTFTPNSKLYTIKLPDGWKFQHQNDDCDCLYAQSMVFKTGTPATITTTQGGRDGVQGFFVVADDSDKSTERFNSSFEQQGTIKAGTLEGNKYYYEQKTDPEGLGLEKGSKQYTYYFVKDGKGIYISYSVSPGEENNLELAEKAVKTLR